MQFISTEQCSKSDSKSDSHRLWLLHLQRKWRNQRQFCSWWGLLASKPVQVCLHALHIDWSASACSLASAEEVHNSMLITLHMLVPRSSLMFQGDDAWDGDGRLKVFSTGHDTKVKLIKDKYFEPQPLHPLHSLSLCEMRGKRPCRRGTPRHIHDEDEMNRCCKGPAASSHLPLPAL